MRLNEVHLKRSSFSAKSAGRTLSEYIHKLSRTFFKWITPRNSRLNGNDLSHKDHFETQAAIGLHEWSSNELEFYIFMNLKIQASRRRVDGEPKVITHKLLDTMAAQFVLQTSWCS